MLTQTPMSDDLAVKADVSMLWVLSKLLEFHILVKL